MSGWAELGLGPNQDSPEARRTLEYAMSRSGNNRLSIPRSDEDDPVRVKFFEDLKLKRVQQQTPNGRLHS